MDTSHKEDGKTLERPLPAEPPTEELGRAHRGRPRATTPTPTCGRT